ncbi:MAG: DNA (cytosine-5-)-methyltransferase [Planctomycetes bacterium]|nr:DNA (cytosine-5-)-methyltransferase [Planctomycetota bacterium]
MRVNTKKNPVYKISTDVDSVDFKRLEKVAKKKGLSPSRVVKDVVHEYLEHDTNKVIKTTTRKKVKHTVVSFFAGCGGLDQGFHGGFDYNGIVFKKHPFEFLAAYDSEQKCVDTYKLNISANAEVRDLSSYDPADIPAADVLIGGFPCQDFATCGPRKGLRSDRGKLYLALVRYAQHHRPKIIVGENVPGLANIAGGEALKIIVGDIEAQGYTAQVWKIFGPDYGVPQNRTRLFIVCVHNDLEGFPEKPEPTHLGKHRSIKWAIEDLEKVHNETIANQSQYFRASKAKKGNGQGDEVSRVDSPAYTVRANAKSRVQFHYSLERRLTIRECARLQTFPDSFYFPHSATTNLMQIGNAVPPMLSHIVATSISKWLAGK